MSATTRVLEAIEEIKKGNMIIMLDDENRENEGDLVYAGTFSTPQKVNFLATHAKGLICVSVPSSTANRLRLNPMVVDNDSSYKTAFTVSVDCRLATTGISAKERDDTIKILSSTQSKAEQLVRPGHIFPLIAKDGGVLERTGHTEGSVDICKIAGIKESYRLANESLVSLIDEKTEQFFGQLATIKEFEDHLGNHHKAVVFGEQKDITNVRFHPTSYDINMLKDKQKFDYMTNSIRYLQTNSGVLVFMDHNQQAIDAKKEFGIGAGILKKLNIVNINLLVSQKVEHIFQAIQGFDIVIHEEIVIK